MALALMLSGPGKRVRSSRGESPQKRKEVERRNIMLWTIAMVLIVLWLFGLVSSYTMGGFIHILLVIAVIVILLRLIQGRRLL
jgi:hypothetical protein